MKYNNKIIIICAIALLALALALALVYSGNSGKVPKTGPPPPSVGITFISPKDRAEFRSGEQIIVVGEVTIPEGYQAPEFFSILFHRSGLNAGTYSVELEPTGIPNTFKFERSLEDLTTPGTYSIRGEANYVRVGPEGSGGGEVDRLNSNDIEIIIVK